MLPMRPSSRTRISSLIRISLTRLADVPLSRLKLKTRRKQSIFTSRVTPTTLQNKAKRKSLKKTSRIASSLHSLFSARSTQFISSSTLIVLMSSSRIPKEKLLRKSSDLSMKSSKTVVFQHSKTPTRFLALPILSLTLLTDHQLKLSPA